MRNPELYKKWGKVCKVADLPPGKIGNERGKICNVANLPPLGGKVCNVADLPGGRSARGRSAIQHRHIYNWNIVACDVKQLLSFTLTHKPNFSCLLRHALGYERPILPTGEGAAVACRARDPGLDSRPRHFNFKDWLSPASMSRYGLKYRYSDVNPQYNQPTKSNGETKKKPFVN